MVIGRGQMGKQIATTRSSKKGVVKKAGGGVFGFDKGQTGTDSLGQSIQSLRSGKGDPLPRGIVGVIPTFLKAIVENAGGNGNVSRKLPESRQVGGSPVAPVIAATLAGRRKNSGTPSAPAAKAMKKGGSIKSGRKA